MGRYNRKKFKQVMLDNEVKSDLTSLMGDIKTMVNPQRRADVTYSKVVRCLMQVPAESIRTRASGVQEVVTSIIFNGHAQDSTSNLQVISLDGTSSPS